MPAIGIKITNNTHRSGKSARDILILDKEFIPFAEDYRFENDNLNVLVKGGYMLISPVEGLMVGAANVSLTSNTGIGVKIYRITKYVYFMITWTNVGVGNEIARSKKTLKMFKVNPSDSSNNSSEPTITFGSGFDICAANSATDINDAFLLAAVNSGDFPNEFIVYRVNQKNATGVCTYYHIYLYMNISTLELAYAKSNGAVSWTTIGADTTYNVNLPYGQDIENNYAYITRKTISNGSVLAYYMLSRNEGVLTKTLTHSNMFKINGKLDSGYSILVNPDYKFSTGYLNESTGEIMTEETSWGSGEWVPNH